MSVAIDNITRNLAGNGSVGDRRLVAESYSVYDNFLAVPKVVRKGIATLNDAETIAREYAKRHPNALVVIVSKKTELKVARIIHP